MRNRDQPITQPGAHAIKCVEKISQSIDFITLRKESIHWELTTIFKVIIICATSSISDKL